MTSRALFSFCHDENYVLIGHCMAQSYSLGYMFGTRSPYQGILKRLFQGTVNLIADILNSRIFSYDQGFTEVGIVSLSFKKSIYGAENRIKTSTLNISGYTEVERTS
jgi:hypothetical protein